MINTNELFQVTETSPAVFANSKQSSLQFMEAMYEIAGVLQQPVQAILRSYSEK